MRNGDERFGMPEELQRQDATPPQIAFPVQNNSVGQQAVSLSFVAPTEFVSLPSKGKYYPQGHALCGKDAIEIKQMTAREEDILTNKSYIKKGIAVDRLLEALIVDKNIKLDDLLIGDKNAVILASRISAYGADYSVQVQCPSCGEKCDHEFNLFKVLTDSNLNEVDYELNFPQDVAVSQNGTFMFRLPSTGWVVEVKPLNGHDEKRIARMTEMRKKLNQGSDSSIIDLLKVSIVSISGVTDRATIEKAIEAMPAKDSKYIRVIYPKIVPDVKFAQEFVCSECSETNELEVPLTAEFFWPKR
jgi:hypothetical protein